MTASLFATEWQTPFGLPPFGSLSPDMMHAAFHDGMAAHMAEIEAIAADQRSADFDTVVGAMERAGQMLSRVARVFYNLSSADTNDALQAIERDMAPLMSRHHSAITLHGGLFKRLDAAFQRRDALGLDAEQMRLLTRTHAGFVRAGAGLDAAGKVRLSAINQRLAEIGTAFSQNLLKDEAGWSLALGEADLAGLPASLKAAMAQAAKERGEDGHMLTLGRSIIEPFLTFSTRRNLREAAFKAWTSRGQMGGETDNRTLIAEMVALRAEKAKLLGFASFAHLKLDDTMAKTPEAVMSLLELVWSPAKARAAREAKDLATLAREEGQNDPIMPWDWRHFAERLRRARYALDEAELKPYFQLDQIIAASFDVASRLFGLSFTPRADLKGYHPDVRIWEVKGSDGSHVGLFLGDYFARASKRSGAWMSLFRSQDKIQGETRPIVVNVCNFAKPAEGQPALLSIDDARTLFHEFGHGLHGLMSNVTWPSLSCTNVTRDFVELPSQLYEYWLMRPEVMARFCRHAETGEAIPEALIAKIKAAQTFNQGFATVEYASSALIDMAFHALTPEAARNVDPLAFESENLKRLGMPSEIVMRHRTPHFAHVFSGDGYAAGYYSYLWSEVMDADAFDAFTDTGDVFDAATAEKLSRFIYSAGNSRDPAEAYTLFRGRMPTPDALMEKRGLKN
ncbi:MAG: M3 family metallopeptidase [Bosea sp. (in: a-proteobacteria)]